jgi:hypothetical protein
MDADGRLGGGVGGGGALLTELVVAHSVNGRSGVIAIGSWSRLAVS